eukprot:TRINITY_DN36557_c0_g1_i1.p1 TRINITY_DN36557_c0_g1~~TRINITY_DN36557_c0_g1_i1.p1  ORF type:complete len:328 (+),score=123.28 TRINITY_DN36557_c0_g1_i1:67-984(+)
MRRARAVGRRAAARFASSDPRMGREADLRQWLTAAGATDAALSRVAISASALPGAGLGLFATAPLVPYDLAAAVPAACVHCGAAAFRDDSFSSLAGILRQMAEAVPGQGDSAIGSLVALYHLAHLMCGGNAQWGPYLAVLPTVEQLKEAKAASTLEPVPPRTATSFGEMDAFAADMLGHDAKEFVKCCNAAHAVYHSRGVVLPGGCLEDEALRAGSPLDRQGGVLVPLVDMVNSSANSGAEPNVAVLAVGNPQKSAPRHRQWLERRGVTAEDGSEFICLVTTRQVQQGDELLLDYTAATLTAGAA